MTKTFYDKVAKKFGGFSYGINNPIYTSECSDGDPEKIFKEKLLKLVTNNKVALDVGCGDCRFAFNIAEHFHKIIGIDNSRELLNVAKIKQKTLNVKNVSFLFQDASKTTFKDESFDIIYCRRGPSFFKEYYRLLKKGGYYLEIGIGGKDAMELKKVFGRGQGYEKMNTPRLLKDKNELKKAGYKIVFAKDYFCSEYYISRRSLDDFLQGVPIFEDYDSKKDRRFLETYIRANTTDKGIKLERHRGVTVSRK